MNRFPVLHAAIHPVSHSHLGRRGHCGCELESKAVTLKIAQRIFSLTASVQFVVN